MKIMFVCVLLSASVFLSSPASAETWTSSLGACSQTAGNGAIYQPDKLMYNRITVLDDINKGVTFHCLIDLRSDKAITRVQVDFSADSASAVKDDPPGASHMIYYLPTCSLTIDYSPGGNDVVALPPSKSVPWGNYDQLAIDNPTVQYAGNGYAQSAVLTCNTPYYGDEIRFFGLRISYED